MARKIKDLNPESSVNSSAAKVRGNIKWVSLLMKLTAVFLLIAIGFVTWRIVDVQAQQRNLKTKLEALSAAGKAIDVAGVKRLHDERTSDELTAEWQALFGELGDPELQRTLEGILKTDVSGGEAVPVPPRGEQWENDAAARKFLSDTKAVRDRLRKLTLKSRAVHFPMQYEGEGHGSSEAHGTIAFATKVLYFEGLAALRYGAIPAAIEDVRCLFAIVRVLEGEPSIMSMAVCGPAELGAIKIVKAAVEQRSLNAKQLAQLLEVLKAYKPSSERFQLAVQGERGMLQSTLGSFAEKQGLLYSILGAPGFRTATLELLDRLEVAPVDDIDGLVKVGSEVLGDIQKLGFGNQSSADSLAPTALIPLTARLSTIASREMERRLAILAVAIQMHRAEFGRFPDEISEVTKLGIDPATLLPVGGKPFGYQVSNDRQTATLWGFSLLSNAKQTPDEPPNTDDPMGLNKSWVWRL